MPRLRTISADRLLLAQGRKLDDTLMTAIAVGGIPVSLIGDSKRVGRLGHAVHNAYRGIMGLSA